MTAQFSNLKSLCILRLSAIGDVCHAVAMVQQIQKQYPEIKITWVLGKVEYRLLQDLPGVEFIIFDKSKGWRGYQELRQHMQHRAFDVLLHMQVALRASIASLFIPASVKIGFDKARAKEGQWLFTNRTVEAQQNPHVLDGFLAFARAIGVKTEDPHWLMPHGEQDTEFVKANIDHPRYAVISPAASKAERNWHAEGYAKSADYLASLGYQVVLCGGPAPLEVDLAKQIEQRCEQKTLNLVGKTSLKQMLAVLENAKLVIAPDTGPAHMAVTVNTPVIGLYAHSNPARTGPYLYQDNVVSVYQQAIEQQQGKPLNDIPFGTRAKGELMHLITFDMVKEQIDKLVKDQRHLLQ
ncbi:glycosyltransferase family 9 protein [Thalassotalea mangrovi]|uniref:Glycosyltransferase family 9 protein n=1 Tax=Thalassotalea mangrovi TaxID=2572245 RepID=A0A4U1B4Y3_9GAMM|nr:glycosyltransferase family 9 protein [Thalassotalea mangrovi]TKB45453.1 glycosyltransferase family 9 protein [Thalassotalea mangrovi]